MASDLVSPVADVLAPEAPEDLEGRTATAEANTVGAWLFLLPRG